MKYRKIISLVVSSVLLLNLFSVLSLVAQAEEIVGTSVVSCPKQSISDAISGRTYYYMNIDGKTTIKPYVTAQNWNSEGTKFLVMTPDDRKMYEYDTVRETLGFLDYGEGSTSLNAVVTPDNQIYYVYNKNIYKIDWNTYTKTLVCPFPYGCKSIGSLQITNDGRYANGYFSGYSGANSVVRIDLESGEIDFVKKKDFSYNPDSAGVGHPIINPEYPELLFFCHEGTTQLIPDRLWIANTETGEMFNAFEQSEREDGLTGECSGHEVWGMDGEYLYFVKYSVDQNIGQRGIVRIKKDGSEREYINDDFAYWHCYPSSDNNWVAGDTNTGQVAIANTKTHESVLLAKFNIISHQHPYQPHPVISYSNNSVNWQMANSNKVCGVAWADISDLTSRKIEGGVVPFGDTTNVISYKNSPGETFFAEKNGVQCIVASAGKSVYADINDDYIKGTNERVRLTVGYIDLGKEPLRIKYSSGVNSKRDLHKFEDHEILIEKTNSGNSKTVEIDLGFVNFNNIGSFGSDLCISSGSEAVYLTDIEANTVSDCYDNVFGRGSFAVSAGENDVTKGLCVVSEKIADFYKNTMVSLDDAEGLKAQGFAESDIASAKKSGAKYITAVSDGGMMHKTATDENGLTARSWFTSINYRADKKNLAGGSLYFRITDDYITEEDNNLVFFAEYLDKGTKDLTLKYCAESGIESLSVPRNDTGLWKIAVFEVDDAMMSSSNKNTALATRVDDFLFMANGEDTYISKVAVMKKSDYEYIHMREFIPCDNSSDNPVVYIVSDIFAEDVSVKQFPRAGWGMEAKKYFSDDLSFVNMSSANLSTQTFLENKYTDRLVQSAKKGDYIFLQLGGDELSAENYRANLRSIADFASQNGFNLVFLTPAHSRVFDSDGRVCDDGTDIYRSAMKDVAKDLGIPLLDIASAHTEHIEALGVKGSEQLFMYTDRKYYPDCEWPDLSDDNALSNVGARELCKIIAGSIKSYEGSGLKSLDKLASYVTSVPALIEAPVYQTITLNTDVKKVGYKIDGSPSSYVRPGNVSVKLEVENKKDKSTDAVLYTVVYNKDGNIHDMSRSPLVTIEPGTSAELESEAVVLPSDSGFKLKKFVWTSSLRPYSNREHDSLSLAVHGFNRRALVTWKKPGGLPADVKFVIYRDGVRVGETFGEAFMDDNVPPGEHSWQVNAVNSLGIFMYQSNFALDYVSGTGDISDDVFYTKAYIDSKGNLSQLSKGMTNYYTSTYYPIEEAQRYYPHLTATNLLEAYSFGNVSYITDNTDGPVRGRRITDSFGVTKDAWQTDRVYRVTASGNKALRDCFMYFSFDDSVISPEDHNVTVYVEYLADRPSLTLHYESCIKDGDDVIYTNESGDRLSNTSVYTHKETGGWHVAKFVLNDAFFNMNGTSFVTGKCDMRLVTQGKPVTISSVTVVKGDEAYGDECIAQLGSMEYYDGYVYNPSQLYPQGVSYSAGSGSEVSDGLGICPVTDNDVLIQRDVDGKYYVSPSSDSQNLLRFEVDDRYMFGIADGIAEIEMTYKADFDGEIILKSCISDMATGSVQLPTDRVLCSVSNSNSWKTAVFRIDNSVFINSMQNGCDFVLYATTDGVEYPLKVRKLALKNANAVSR